MGVEPRNNQPDKGKMFTKGKGSKITNADILAVGMIKKKISVLFASTLFATTRCHRVLQTGPLKKTK